MQPIAVVTTSRADYGIYRPLLRAMRNVDMTFELLVGGSHLSAAHGHTVDAVRADGYGPIRVVAHQTAGDGDMDIARSASAAIDGFAGCLADIKPQLTVVLGDRYEMLAAGFAAALMRTPIAHLHGGDVTEGAYDEQFRHALTKLSHLHFPSIAAHANRIMAMGEEPWRVTVVGALALDALAGFTPPPRGDLLSQSGCDPALPTLLVLYHPETLDAQSPHERFAAISAALDQIKANVVVIGGNADTGHQQLRRAMRDWVGQRPNARYVAALSQESFWGWMSHADALVGNSSAGPIEAASFRLPVVNIGGRQRGRHRAANVIDVPCETGAIGNAVTRAISPEFRVGLHGLENPYGDGRAAGRILTVLKHLPTRDLLLHKKWPGGALTALGCEPVLAPAILPTL